MVVNMAMIMVTILLIVVMVVVRKHGNDNGDYIARYGDGENYVSDEVVNYVLTFLCF